MATSRDKLLSSAQRYLEKGNFSRAVREYRKVLKLHPNDIRTRLRVGDLLVRLGKRDEAVETYEEVAAEYAREGFFLKSVAILKQILRLDPIRTDIQAQLAELYIKLNLLSDSMAQYRKVAETLRANGEMDRYVDICRRMTEIDPDHVPTRISLAEQLSQLGRTDEAADEFMEAARRLLSRDRLEDYVKVAERYIFHRPDDLETLKELIEVYLDRTDPKRALAKLQLLFKLAPTDTEAHELLARSFLLLGKNLRAVRVLKELADLYVNDGREELAIDTYHRILDIDPEHGDARAYLGMSRPSMLEAPGAEPADVLTNSVLPPPYEQPPIRESEIADDERSQWRRLKAASGLFTAPNGVTTCNRDVVVSNLDRVSRLLADAEGFVSYGLFDRAEEALGRVFEIDPLNISAMEQITKLRRRQGDFDGAVQQLLTMAKLCWRPDPVRSASYLHQALELGGEHPDAIALRAELGLDGIDLETFMLETAEDGLDPLVDVSGGIGTPSTARFSPRRPRQPTGRQAPGHRMEELDPTGYGSGPRRSPAAPAARGRPAIHSRQGRPGLGRSGPGLGRGLEIGDGRSVPQASSPPEDLEDPAAPSPPWHGGAEPLVDDDDEFELYVEVDTGTDGWAEWGGASAESPEVDYSNSGLQTFHRVVPAAVDNDVFDDELFLEPDAEDPYRGEDDYRAPDTWHPARAVHEPPTTPPPLPEDRPVTPAIGRPVPPSDQGTPPPVDERARTEPVYEQPDVNDPPEPGHVTSDTALNRPRPEGVPELIDLPPLPPGLPDDLLEDIEELDFYAHAGLVDEAQQLLFELTTNYPEHTVLLMERMEAIEARVRKGD